MAVTTFDNIGYYLEGADTILERIRRIDQVLLALENAAITSAMGQHIDEYWLDDGQSKIKTIYRSSHDIEKSITAFDKIKQRYLNRLNGRTINLRDSRSIKYRDERIG